MRAKQHKAQWSKNDIFGSDIKSDNLQYNMLVCWFAGTNDLSTKLAHESKAAQSTVTQNKKKKHWQDLLQFILRGQLRDPHFFQNCGSFHHNISWLFDFSKNYHNFETNEDCATIFLKKWTLGVLQLKSDNLQYNTVGPLDDSMIILPFDGPMFIW